MGRSVVIMDKSSRSVIFVVILAIACIAISLYFGFRKKHVTPSPHASIATAKETPPTETRGDQSSAPPASGVATNNRATGLPSDASSAKSRLNKDFGTASDLRVFVEHAKQMPEAGGVFYANAALVECRLLRTDGLRAEKLELRRSKLRSESEPQSVRRLEALAQLERRCAGFTDAELSVDEQAFLLHWGAPKDPLASLRREAVRSTKTGVNERIEILRRVLQSNDPLLMEGAKSLSMNLSETTSDIAYVDGLPFGELDAARYFSAWDLAICEHFSTCSTIDSRLQMECAFGGGCFDSVYARVRSQLSSEKEYLTVARVSSRLRQAIITGMVDIFLPPTNKQ